MNRRAKNKMMMRMARSASRPEESGPESSSSSSSSSSLAVVVAATPTPSSQDPLDSQLRNELGNSAPLLQQERIPLDPEVAAPTPLLEVKSTTAASVEPKTSYVSPVKSKVGGNVGNSQSVAVRKASSNASPKLKESKGPKGRRDGRRRRNKDSSKPKKSTSGVSNNEGNVNRRNNYNMVKGQRNNKHTPIRGGPNSDPVKLSEHSFSHEHLCSEQMFPALSARSTSVVEAAKQHKARVLQKQLKTEEGRHVLLLARILALSSIYAEILCHATQTWCDF